MIDDTAITRRMNLMQLLAARRLGATVREIAGEIQASERTIRRDLNSLCKINFPIEESTGDRARPMSKLKRWRLIRIVRKGAQQALAGEDEGAPPA